MGLSTAAEPVPFKIDEHGVARVGGTRVPLEVIVGLHRMGESANTIHRNFPTVDSADIYQVIGYSIRHQHEVDEYLQLAAQEEEDAIRRMESQPGYYEHVHTLRARLLSRTQE